MTKVYKYVDDEKYLNNILKDFKGNLVDYIEKLKNQAELAEHYKHLYSELKKQKDDVVEYIKHEWFKREQIGVCDKSFQQWEMEDLLRMLGEKDV